MTTVPKAKLGIESLKELIQLVGSGAAAGVALSDGFQFNDVVAFVGIARALPPVIRDRNAIIPEFKDLDALEKEELSKYVDVEIDLPAAVGIEEFLEKALKFAIALSGLIDLFGRSEPAA